MTEHELNTLDKYDALKLCDALKDEMQKQQLETARWQQAFGWLYATLYTLVENGEDLRDHKFTDMQDRARLLFWTGENDADRA